MHKIRYIYVQIIRELMLELVYHFCVGCVIQWNGYAEREIRREICGAAGSGRINIIFTMNICWDCGTWVSLYCTNMKTNENTHMYTHITYDKTKTRQLDNNKLTATIVLSNISMSFVIFISFFVVVELCSCDWDNNCVFFRTKRIVST